MGIRPSAETGSGDGNQLAVDQIGEVYANVKTVADNIADVSQVAENLDQLEELGDVAEQTLTNATAAANSAAAADASADAASASQIAAAASALSASADADTATAAVAEIDADRVAAEAAAVSALASKNAAETANTNAQAAKTAAETASAAAVPAAATATTKAAEALASANTATTKAAEALASANLADADRIAASGHAADADADRIAAEAAKVAALAAQAAAEAARDEAEGIAGGDIVTGAEFDAGMALTAKLGSANVFTANNTFSGGVNRFKSDSWGRAAIFGAVNGEAVADASIVLSNTNYYNTIDFQSGVGDPNAVASYGSLVSSASIGLFFNFDNGVTFRNKAGTVTYFSFTAASAASAVPITVPADAYGAGWNGSLKVATQDAVYDEIEALKGLVVGAMVYKGTWNANTNTPAIPAASAANKGWFYKVATAGTTSVSGIADWGIGDWIVSNGTAWDKIDNTEVVSSVNGQTGAVSLTASSFTLTGFSSATGGAIVATDTVLAAFGKAQNSIDTLAAAIANKTTDTNAYDAYVWVGADGGAVVGNYIDFHSADNDGNDWAARLQVTSNQLNVTAANGFKVNGAAEVTGALTLGGYISANFANTQLMLKGGAASMPTAMHRVDATNYYFLLSAASAGEVNGTWNALRPITIELATGKLFSQNAQYFEGGLTTPDTINITPTGTNTGRINIARGGLAASSIFDDGNLHIYTPTAAWYDAGGHTFGPSAGGGGWAAITSSGLSSLNLALTRTGADPTISLLRTGGNTCTVRADSNTLYMTAPNVAMRGATHYLQTEDGATTMVTTTLNGGNPKMTMGPSGSTATATPTQLDLGGTFTNSPGNNAKLLIHNAGYGLGVSSGAFENLAPSGAKYIWYINAANEMELTTTGLTVNGTVTATSDRRRKKKIKTVRNALDAVCRMRGVTFEWRKTNLKSAGVIAQEHQEVAPEAVHTDDKGFLSVNDAATTAYLIEAIKELKGIVDAQAARIAELEAR